jgi:O-antigen ligase
MEKKKKQYNFYDRTLSVLIALQIFGVYGGAFEPIRIFILLMIPFSIIYLNKKGILRVYKYEYRYFMIFLIYAILTTLFVIDQVAAIKELSYLCVNFSSLFVIIYLASKSLNPKRSIINGWILLFILTIPVAFIEIFFDFHLPVSILQSDEIIGGIGESRRSASITFGNYNAYNVLLIYTFPFLAALLLIRKTFVFQLLGWAAILILFFIIMTNASRGSLICISITFGIFLFYYLKSKVKGKYIFISSISTVIAYLVIKYYDIIFTLVSYRFSNLGIEDNTRSQIIYNSLTLFLNSYCLGVGAGNFQSSMKYYYSFDIVAPHNFFLEIVVQYGLFIFIGFIILLVRLYKKVRKETISPYRFIVFTSLLVYPLASAINSGYIDTITIWIQLGSLFIVADSKFSFGEKLSR